MGGNIFESNKRLSQKDYISYCDEVSCILNTHAVFGDFYIPPSFKNKKDYGDLDIICKNPTVNYREEILRVFRTNLYHKNGNTFSVSYKDFQIDFIIFEADVYQPAKDYYSHSDCSNIMGQLCSNALGYRLTHAGMKYPVRVGESEHIGEILVSTDREKICGFLDLDYVQWKDGFDDEEALFSWIKSSKYYHPRFFAFENLNHENRIRNKKRSVYKKFVDSAKEDNTSNYNYRFGNKQDHLFRGMVFFGKELFLENISAFISEKCKNDAFKNVFNGSHMHHITGLDKKELGAVIASWKAFVRDHYPDVSYEEQIITWQTEECEKMFRIFYDTYAKR